MEDKTLYEMILEKLGIEKYERFNILLDGNEPSLYDPYHFDEGYLIDGTDDVADDAFAKLLTGKAIIEKLPWEPKLNDNVWYVNMDGEIYMTSLSNCVIDLAMLECGWYFRTKKEAEANRERVLAEMKEILDNE